MSPAFIATAVQIIILCNTILWICNAAADDVSEGICKKLMADFSINTGISWGTAGSKEINLWKSTSCDSIILKGDFVEVEKVEEWNKRYDSLNKYILFNRDSSKERMAKLGYAPLFRDLKVSRKHDYIALVGILTTASHLERRLLIRSTYMGSPSCVKIVFAICHSSVEIDVTLLLESIHYGDLIFLKCTENMNGGKSFVWFRYIQALLQRNKYKIPYILKGDDDTYINLRNLEMSIRLHMKIAPTPYVYYGLRNWKSPEPNARYFIVGMLYGMSWKLLKLFGQIRIPVKPEVAKEKRGCIYFGAEDAVLSSCLYHLSDLNTNANGNITVSNNINHFEQDFHTFSFTNEASTLERLRVDLVAIHPLKDVKNFLRVHWHYTTVNTGNISYSFENFQPKFETLMQIK